MRCGVEDVVQLEKLLKLFFGYERPEIEAFRKAVEQFKTDLPAVLEALRAMIERARETVPRFPKGRRRVSCSTRRRQSTQALQTPTCARC